MKERLAATITRDRNRDFWTKVRKIAGKTAGTSATVDGISEPNSIAELFANKYQSLHRIVSYSTSDMDKIKQRIQSDIANISTTGAHSANISAVEVGMCVATLKFHKNDGGTGLNTNHFKYASTDLHYHVALLLSAVVCHGNVPKDFLLCTTIPMPKGNTNRAVSGNYRGITLSSVFGQLIDLLILHRYSDVLGTCDLQFGFKAKRSTAMCSMVLKDAILYYVNHGSSVFCIFLDATKAFDRVQYCSLFDKLLDRNVHVRQYSSLPYAAVLGYF